MPPGGGPAPLSGPDVASVPPRPVSLGPDVASIPSSTCIAAAICAQVQTERLSAARVRYDATKAALASAGGQQQQHRQLWQAGSSGGSAALPEKIKRKNNKEGALPAEHSIGELGVLACPPPTPLIPPPPSATHSLVLQRRSWPLRSASRSSCARSSTCWCSSRRRASWRNWSS